MLPVPTPTLAIHQVLDITILTQKSGLFAKWQLDHVTLLDMGCGKECVFFFLFFFFFTRASSTSIHMHQPLPPNQPLPHTCSPTTTPDPNP